MIPHPNSPLVQALPPLSSLMIPPMATISTLLSFVKQASAPVLEDSSYAAFQFSQQVLQEQGKFHLLLIHILQVRDPEQAFSQQQIFFINPRHTCPYSL